eukprot:SAG11_NODE_4239_length_1993_cov_1.817318_3_plen_64_part_00
MNNTANTYSKKYYELNRDKILAYQKEYYKRKKQINTKKTSIKFKYGKFILFDPKKPCIVNWDD